MPSLSDHPRTAEFLLSEANGWRSREAATVTVAADTTLKAGHVLEASAAKYVTMTTSASAAAILYNELVNTGTQPADFAATIIVRDAEVRKASLEWSSGTYENWAAAITALEALGLRCR